MKALVLCGGMPQAYLVKLLKERGYTVVLADRNEKAPAVKLADIFYPASTLDVDAIRDIAKKEAVDFVISVCADQMLLVAAQVCEELGLPCYIDYETAKNVSSKEYMKRIFVENGIPTSKHIIRATLCDEDVKDLEFPLVVKPVDSYSSRGVKRVETMEELYEAFDVAVNISRTKTAVVEEFVGGDEYSVDLYVENGVANIICMRVLDKIPDIEGFVICRGRYPAPASAEKEARIREVGQKIADAFGLVNTPMLIQMKVDGDRISVLEFCARTGGGIKYRLMPKVSEFDVVKAVLDLTEGKKPHYEGFRYKGYIIDEFLYAKPGVLDHYEGFEELYREGIVDHYEVYRTKGFECKSASCSGDRVAYYSVQADTPEELERRQRIANERVKAISDTGEDLIRHDIVRFINY